MHRLAVLRQHKARVRAVGYLVPLIVIHVQQLGRLAVKDDPQPVGLGAGFFPQRDVAVAMHQHAVVCLQKELLLQRFRLPQQRLGGQLRQGQLLAALVQQPGLLGQLQAVGGL